MQSDGGCEVTGCERPYYRTGRTFIEGVTIYTRCCEWHHARFRDCDFPNCPRIYHASVRSRMDGQDMVTRCCERHYDKFMAMRQIVSEVSREYKEE